MSDLFRKDARIEENSALRDLEKKVHWLMYQLSRAGMATDLQGLPLSIPRDCNTADIENDAQLIAFQADCCGVKSGSEALAQHHQRLLGAVGATEEAVDAPEPK